MDYRICDENMKTMQEETEEETEELKWWENLASLAILVMLIWFFITMFTWLFINVNSLSLLDILKSQWVWLSNLRII